MMLLSQTGVPRRGSRRLGAWLVFALFAAGTILAAQSAVQLPGLLQQLQSRDLNTRVTAYSAILEIPHADTRPEVQKAFVQLLLTEEQVTDAAWLQDPADGPDGVYGEGYGGDYLESLVGEVVAYAELTDSEDPATVTALVHTTAGDPASPRVAWLASRTSLKPSELAAMIKSPILMERSMGRSNLAGLIIANRNGKRKLSDADHALVKRALIASLKDPALDGRNDAVDKISAAGDPDPDFIKALTDAAASDPQMRRSALRAASDLKSVH
ncbi:MAG TPA: hypothetical protein VN690_09670 [Terriglobales bacterium]|nr:hypothetical protein [Terriglobales bacterium]